MGASTIPCILKVIILINFGKKKLKKQNFENLDFGSWKVYGRTTKFSKWESKNTRFCFGIYKLSTAKKRNVLPSKSRPVKTFKVGKQKENFSGEHLKDDKQLALPPRRPKHGLRFLNSTTTVKSQCTTEQLGPQGLIMDTKYGKKAMIGRNKLRRAMKRCDSRGRTLYYLLTFVPLPDELPVVAW